MGAMVILGSLTLPGTNRAVAYARRFVLDMVGADWPRSDDVRMCTSELVTNAVQHSPSGQGGRVTIVVGEARECMRISVINEGEASGALEPRGELMDEHGRGLLIVGALADAWGVERGDGSTGIWFEIAL